MAQRVPAFRLMLLFYFYSVIFALTGVIFGLMDKGKLSFMIEELLYRVLTSAIYQNNH